MGNYGRSLHSAKSIVIACSKFKTGAVGNWSIGRSVNESVDGVIDGGPPLIMPGPWSVLHSADHDRTVGAVIISAVLTFSPA